MITALNLSARHILQSYSLGSPAWTPECQTCQFLASRRMGVRRKFQRLLVAVLAVPDISGGRPSYQGAATRLTLLFLSFSKEVPNVDDVSLVDGVFDSAFGVDGEEDHVMGEGVMRRLEWKPRRYGRGEEKCGEDDEEHGEGDYFTRMNVIKEVKHESYERRIQKWFSKMQKH
ncbi:hypothetical protein Tco_0321186 [Tanacetum coccineum]